MTREDLLELSSKELKETKQVLEQKLTKLHEQEEKIKEMQNVITTLIIDKEKEELVNKIKTIARNNEAKAIALFGGKKYVFNFGDFRFIPLKKCLKKKELDIVKWYMHSGMGFVCKKDMYEFYKEKKKTCFAHLYPEYEHSDFYAKSTLKKVDLFYCLENGLMYIPTTYELMQVDNETLKKLDLYDTYSEVLENNIIYN